MDRSDRNDKFDATPKEREDRAIELMRQGRYDEARELVGDDFVDGWMHAQEGP